MTPKIKKRLIRIAIFSALALVIGGGVAWVQVQMQSARVTTKEGKPTETALPVAGLNIGGPFNPTDQDSNPVNEKSWGDSYKLIYFGFTYCPAICPTELQKISQVMKALEAKQPQLAAKIQPLFITVDPERDTVPVMKDYVRLFHPRLAGLTGTQPQIDFVKKSFRIFASKVQEEGMSDYTIDHSSFIYLMGPDNTLVAMYRMDDSADTIYADLVKKL